MKLVTFKGGVHPNDGKSLAKDKAIKVLKPKGTLVYPLSKHIGAPAPVSYTHLDVYKRQVSLHAVNIQTKPV